MSIDKQRDYVHVISYRYTVVPDGANMCANVLQGLALSELGSYDRMTVTVNENSAEEKLLKARGFVEVVLADKCMLLCYREP